MAAPPKKPLQKRSSGDQRKQGQKNRWPQREVRLAALWTTHPPAAHTTLAPDPALGLRTRLEFEPYGCSITLGLSLGLLHTSYLPATLHFAPVLVKRGRWGNKPPEALLPLQELPSDVLAWPSVRLRGALRSLAEAAEAVAIGPLPPDHELAGSTLWLAGQLALKGLVNRHEFKVTATKSGWKQPKAGPEVEVRGGAWVWRVYARDLAGKLERELLLPRRVNPYRTELSRTQAARLLRRDADKLTAAALEELAKQHKLKQVHAAYPEAYELSGKLAPAKAAATDELAAPLLAPFTAGGANLRTLDVSTKQLGTLNQLIEAERIVDLHYGFTVGIALLRQWLTKLKPDIDNPPSTREIKDRLGLGRREAEALRGWLVAQKVGGK